MENNKPNTIRGRGAAQTDPNPIRFNSPLQPNPPQPTPISILSPQLPKPNNRNPPPTEMVNRNPPSTEMMNRNPVFPRYLFSCEFFV